MATLYINEYEKSVAANAREWGYSFNGLQVAHEPAIADQTVAIGGASVASTAFGAKTRCVRIHTDSICSIKFGAANAPATALITSARMTAGQTEYFGVDPGMTVSVIANT